MYRAPAAQTLVKTINMLAEALDRLNPTATPRAYDVTHAELEATKLALVAELAEPLAQGEMRTITVEHQQVEVRLFTNGTGMTTVSVVDTDDPRTLSCRSERFQHVAERLFAETVLTYTLGR